MEKDFNTDNFEQLLREATDNFRMYPSKRVWHGIYNDMHPAKKWPSFAALLLLITSIMYIGVTNPDKGGQTQADISSEANKLPAETELTTINNRNSGNLLSLTATPTRSNSIVNTLGGSSQPVPTETAHSEVIALSPDHTVLLSGTEVAVRPQTATLIQQDVIKGNTAKGANTLRNSADATSTQQQFNTSLVASIPNDDNKATYSDPIVTTVSALGLNPAVPKTDDVLSMTIPARTSATAIPTNTFMSSGADQTGWMEDFALRNLKPGYKWKGRMSYQIYVTPSLGYRKLNKTRDYSLPPTNSLVANPNAASTTNYTLNHSSAINLELGTGMIYNASKVLRLKAGVQINFTNYTVNAQELNHPTFTALMLTNTFTNGPVLSSRTTTIANTTGNASRYLNNSTYQISLPIGADFKVAGNDKLKVYLGGTLQPTYILGGQSYLVSADMKNYVADASFIRKQNLNGAVEAFVTYKTKSGVTLNAGPQFRYQFFSTYNSMYTYDEKLYNLGVKLGMTKNF